MMVSYNTGFWALPYAHQRKPVVAANMVATTQPLAAQAGIQALKQGGNAMDAALATAIALTVVEPVMNGIGGDAFVLLWIDGKLHGLNASGRAPLAWSPEFFAGRERMPDRGWETVTVPGQVAGWATLSERFGQLPFERLFDAAIDYAQNGFAVSPVVARQWANFAPELLQYPGFAEAFTRDGAAPVAGTIWRFPAQARTLEAIAATRGADFYSGEIARKIVRFAEQTGGALSLEDLQSHQCDWVTPLEMPYRDGFSLYELPPNGQGIAALMAVGMLKHLPAAKSATDVDGLYHYPIEAVRLAFADLHRYVSDAAHMEVLAEQLLDEHYLQQRAALIKAGTVSAVQAGVPEQAGTVYLTTADQQGNMVSFIQSNFQGFGSGVVVPETGIALQNRGRGFSLQPGHPNLVGPGKRSMHTIIPGFITRHGQPWTSFGVMGGSMQAQGHVQMMRQLVDLGRNPQTAIEAPRFRVEQDGSLWLEHGAGKQTAAVLQRYGHRPVLQPVDSLEFGSAQAIMRLDTGVYVAGSDARRDGLAIGF